eukprot:COSAG01_NODE_2636_length_7330_cov_3.975384_5_plen_37_part_00
MDEFDRHSVCVCVCVCVCVLSLLRLWWQPRPDLLGG